MLPSTGYFKGINCPFYDSGLCERPYCHFRHVKKDSFANASSDGIESGAILQKLVSAAVQRVLQHTEASATTKASQHATAAEGGDANKVNNSQLKATYNPTPIAELKKINVETENNGEVTEQRRRHIPVPYTPRKPASVPIKRPIEDNGPSKPFVFIPPPFKYTPGCSKSVQLDPYTPKGSIESEEKYLPGTETELQEYKPKDTQTQPSSKHNYVPSERSINKKKVLEYRPTKVSTKSETPSVTYQPTPKSLVPCFSSDEDEPDPKKMKLSHDLNGLDDLGPEFDILDQILDEENLSNSNEKSINNEKSRSNEKSNNNEKSSNNEKSKEKEEPESNNLKEQESKKHTENSRKHKKSSNRHNDKKQSHKIDDKKSHEKSHEKSKTEKDKKSDSNSKLQKSNSKSDNKSKDTHKTHTDKKSHKSSSKDKNKEENKVKPEKDRDKQSSSKKTDKNSKQSSSKSSDRHSKSSSSSISKHDSKQSEKRDHHHHKSSKKSSKGKYKKSKEKQLTNNNYPDNDAEDTTFDNNNDDLLELSESDEETIALECKRIFEEYVPTEKSSTSIDQDNINKSLVLDISNDSEYIPSKKRISRTTDKNIKILPKAPLKPDYKVSAAQAMAERLAKIKEFHGSRSLPIPSNNEPVSIKQEPPRSSFSAPHSTNAKIRIAHVPYASTMMNAKKVITPISKIKPEEPSTSSTVIQTVKKGAQRIAHIPNEKFIDRPGVLEPLASKIAANIRSTYLNMMIDECLKIYLSPTDAYARAQHEELITSKKCSTVQIYKNSAVLTVSRLRKEFQECNGVKRSSSDCTALQRIPQTISGNTSNVGSWSIESKRTVNNSLEFTGAKFYKNVYKWVLTEEQLQDNGFPRPHESGEKGRAIIYGQNKKTPPKGLIRSCCRCKKDYIVDKKGFPAIEEECIYHPNNKYKVRGEAKYQCCSQDSSSDGCCVAPCHVYEYVDYENLKGFIKTMPPDCEMDDYGVYSLDCEMCYTTQGLDLTRVTVINSACKVVYETLIKPLHPIIDYNTRYSGITEEQMANVKTTLLEVQATLLSMFSSETILVGHSLESDFKALKLIHDTVIDTSVLFPHKMGPPFKRALRNLSSEYLKKIIQNSVEGHDSAEDATVCMELLIYKLKEDLKTR